MMGTAQNTKQAKSLRGLAHMIWRMLTRVLASLRSHGTKVTPTAALAYMLLLPLLFFSALFVWMWVCELWFHDAGPGLLAFAGISSVAFPIVAVHRCQRAVQRRRHGETGIETALLLAVGIAVLLLAVGIVLAVLGG